MARQRNLAADGSLARIELPVNAREEVSKRLTMINKRGAAILARARSRLVLLESALDARKQILDSEYRAVSGFQSPNATLDTLASPADDAHHY